MVDGLKVESPVSEQKVFPQRFEDIFMMLRRPEAVVATRKTAEGHQWLAR